MREIDFPPEWVTGDPIQHDAYYPVAGRTDIHLVGVLLDDGANLWTLIYPGGTRFLRTDGTDLSVKEREVGPPDFMDRRAVDEAWGFLKRADRAAAISAMVEVDAIERRN
jgi:hypothetical protein